VDPVTTAVIAAVSAGASSEVTKKAISDGYESLKSLLKKKYGSGSDVTEAVDRLESTPADSGRRQSIEYELDAVSGGADPELLAAAQALLDEIKSQPGGEQYIQHVQGDFNAVADRGGSASVTIHGSVNKRQ
jgi:hypothetical protein